MRNVSYPNLLSEKPMQPKNTILYNQTRSTLTSKRVFDVVVSLLVIALLLSWLLPILAILIKLDSRGPVLFIQKRIGANGKLFYCLKLRSMVVNTLANTQQAKANDPRITKLGNFLRKSCMDELPQFFNVLMGDMSIVGPRPHMVKDCEDFSKLIPNYGSRHCVKPGITGMAQVKGYRGETHDFFDVAHRYKWDVFYVKNNSFLLDLQIIHRTSVQTVLAVLKSSEAKKDTKPAVVRTIPAALPKTRVIKQYQEQLAEA